MALFEDAPPAPKTPHRLGEDLAAISIDELKLRVELLQAEIARIEQAISHKENSKVSAAAFFKR